MNTNCPNCAAPITSDHCEYCGTIFKDTARAIELRTFLELENECLQKQIEVQMLYQQAINAMRAYNSGLITMREAREWIGLETNDKEEDYEKVIRTISGGSAGLHHGRLW